MFKNIKKLFSSKKRFIMCMLWIISLSLLWWYSTDFRIMFGNYWLVHTYTDILLSWFIIITFPIFITALLYKSYKYWKRADINWKSINWIIGWIAGTIISGASCCWATLAASFGFLPLMTFLPYSGLEIKIIAAIWLLYALIDTLIHLETCKVKK